MYITRRIGSTTYKIKVCFSADTPETMEDKFLRIVKNHILADGKFCGIIDLPQMSRSA